MWVSQIWYTKEEGQYHEDEDVIKKENNCLDPNYVDKAISVEQSELHNWNKPKIEEIMGGFGVIPGWGHVKSHEVASGWRHFKSYELDMFIYEMPDKTKYEVWNEDRCLDEGIFTERDLKNCSLDKWIRYTFLENYEPFNECDELFKKYSDFDVEDEIFDLLRKYREDPNSWSGKNALFNAGCLAKRKLCEHAVFYNKDEWEVTDCPEDIEDLHFCLVTLHV